MKFMLLFLALSFSLQSFAYEAVRGQSGFYYIKCKNGDSGGKYASKDDALGDGARLCAGREYARYRSVEAGPAAEVKGASRNSFKPVIND